MSQYGVSSVTHDITYGEGLITILSSDLRIPEYYYNKGLPAICTDETGRNIKPGVYVPINLVSYDFSEKKLFQKASKLFNFGNSLHFVRFIKNTQHFISFLFSKLSDAEFYYSILNNKQYFEKALNRYLNSNKDLFSVAKSEKEKLRLPYSKNYLLEYKISHIDAIPFQKKRCLELLSQGLCIKEISEKMSLSPRTVESYLHILRRKFRVTNSRELIFMYQDYC